MGSFWRQAQGAAAREFGARNMGLFVFLAAARKLLPALAVLVALAAVGGLGFGVVTTWDTWSPWAPTVVVWLSVAAGIALVVAFGSWVWRNRWRWY